MTFSDMEMMELGITQPTNIRNTRSSIRTLKYVLDILQTEEASTVEEYKHTHSCCISLAYIILVFSRLLTRHILAFVPNWEKSAVKYSIEKTILINFLSFSTIFCPRLHLLAGLLIREARDALLEKDFAINRRASLSERVGVDIPTRNSPKNLYSLRMF